MVGTIDDVLENSLSFERKNSADGLNINDSMVNIDDNISVSNYMQLKLDKGNGEKNNEERGA